MMQSPLCMFTHCVCRLRADLGAQPGAQPLWGTWPHTQQHQTHMFTTPLASKKHQQEGGGTSPRWHICPILHALPPSFGFGMLAFVTCTNHESCSSTHSMPHCREQTLISVTKKYCSSKSGWSGTSTCTVYQMAAISNHTMQDTTTPCYASKPRSSHMPQQPDLISKCLMQQHHRGWGVP